MREDGLGTQLGNAVRDVAADQAAAYTKYAALLKRFSQKEVDLLNFGRNALDIYADAWRDWTQVGGRLANDSLKTGIAKAKSFRLVKTANGALDAVVTAASAPTRARKAATPRKKPV